MGASTPSPASRLVAAAAPPPPPSTPSTGQGAPPRFYCSSFLVHSLGGGIVLLQGSWLWPLTGAICPRGPGRETSPETEQRWRVAFLLRTLLTLPRGLNLSFKIHVSAAELRRRGFPGHETPPPTCPQEKPRCLGHGHPHLRLRPCCQQVRDGGRSLSSSGSPAPGTGPGGGGGFTLRASPTHTSLHSRRSPTSPR